jgi:hypothetical protein
VLDLVSSRVSKEDAPTIAYQAVLAAQKWVDSVCVLPFKSFIYLLDEKDDNTLSQEQRDMMSLSSLVMQAVHDLVEASHDYGIFPAAGEFLRNATAWALSSKEKDRKLYETMISTLSFGNVDQDQARFRLQREIAYKKKKGAYKNQKALGALDFHSRMVESFHDRPS